MKLNSMMKLVSVSCEEASRLTSDALDRELSRSERWALRLHTFLCGSCRRLVRQLATIRMLLSGASDRQRRAMLQQLPRLSVERKAQIKQLLRERLHGETI